MDNELRSRYNATLEGLRNGDMPLFEDVRGRVSPYTNLPIETPEQYDEYLRQFALSVSYLEMQNAAEQDNKILRDRLDNVQQRLDAAQKEKARDLRRFKILRSVFFIVSLVLFIIVLCIPGWRNTSYKAGYSAAEAIGKEQCAAAEADGKERYAAGYEIGYQAGAASVPYSTFPSPSPSSSSHSSSSSTRSTYLPSSSGTSQTSTVYVSRAGKIHLKSNCSGMKNYTTMNYDDAVTAGYSFCSKCF